MLSENGCALSDNEVQKAVNVEKRLENCLGKRWEAAKLRHTIDWSHINVLCLPQGLAGCIAVILRYFVQSKKLCLRRTEGGATVCSSSV